MRLVALILTVILGGMQTPVRPPLLHGQSLVHAHNAYPEGGQWSDRIDRALAIGQVPAVIEQDVAFAPRNAPEDRSVVAHDAKLAATAPSLRRYFFDRVRPMLERAVTEGRPEQWPVVVLHLDFKSNEREHHRAVWDLLKQHQAWLTTAAVSSDPARVAEVKRGPLLVLTENGDGQERDFTEWAAAEGSLLLFGSIPAPVLPASDDPAERARILRVATPRELVPTAATNYRRWVNFSWGAVEEGGPSRAGDWTREDQDRLDAVVSYAHRQGLLVRFYTLNGHTAAMNRGWTASYNFGDLEAARRRWRGAMASGVDLIA
ncbi:MAG TPA: hypothetical protein VD863_27620, partial [Bradyrhizobium sp.]|nr:hypothetical protein [Bradyrhizobium sp.]